MRKMMLVLMMTVMTAAPAFAGLCAPPGEFYRDAYRGWFYGEWCEGAAPDNKTTSDPDDYRMLDTTVVSIPWDRLDRMHPDGIAKLQKESHAIAIMHPTDTNVTEYKKLIVWINDQARQYARVDDRIARVDPGETAPATYRVPSTTWAKDAVNSAKTAKTDAILATLADRAGLVVFVSSTCDYCEQQKPILEWLSRDYGWTYQLADISQFPNARERASVEMVPDIFIVLKDGEEARWQRVSTGLTTYDALKDAIIFGLSTMGEVQDETILR